MGLRQRLRRHGTGAGHGWLKDGRRFSASTGCRKHPPPLPGRHEYTWDVPGAGMGGPGRWDLIPRRAGRARRTTVAGRAGTFRWSGGLGHRVVGADQSGGIAGPGQARGHRSSRWDPFSFFLIAAGPVVVRGVRRRSSRSTRWGETFFSSPPRMWRWCWPILHRGCPPPGRASVPDRREGRCQSKDRPRAYGGAIPPAGGLPVVRVETGRGGRACYHYYPGAASRVGPLARGRGRGPETIIEEGFSNGTTAGLRTFLLSWVTASEFGAGR